MPQLVKGGKHAYGWSDVSTAGFIRLPPEALGEYALHEGERLFVVPGSRTSGGFGLATPASLRRSPLGRAVRGHPDLVAFRQPEGEPVVLAGKPYSWVQLRDGQIRLPATTLSRYGIGVGDSLLAIRGSGLALALAVRGPIVEEARRHPELERFVPAAGSVVDGDPR